MERQAAVVRSVVTDGPPVIPVICFVESRWSLFASPLRFGDVRVLWPKMLYKLLRAKGQLTAADIARLEFELAEALPPA
jgi:hypothetical protein